MRIILLGMNEFGESAFLTLLEKGARPIAVVVPDKNRTKRIQKIAAREEIKLLTFSSFVKKIEQLKPDLIIIASFSKILPPSIFNLPKFGTVNIHPGELPRYRGAHPIQWALINGEKSIWVTLHVVDKGIDTGDILSRAKIWISDADDINSLIIGTAKKGALLAWALIRKLENGIKIQGIKQKKMSIPMLKARKPSDSRIQWNLKAEEIFNLIRSSASSYNAFSFCGKTKINLKKARFITNPGTVLARKKEDYLVLARDGVVWVKSKRKIKVGQVLK